MRALAPGAKPQLDEEPLSAEEAALYKLLSGSRSGPAYVEEGSTVLTIGVLDYTIPWGYEKATANLRFNRNYVQDPNDPPQDIRAVIMEVTTLHVKIRLSGAPTHGNLIWRWQVVAPEALVDPNPSPEGPQFILNSVTLGSAARTIESKLGESISLLDYGGVGDNLTNNDAAFTAALADASPIIFVPASTFVTTLTEAQLAGKRFTGPGFIKGAGGAYPNYRGPANFTRLDTSPANDYLGLEDGDYRFVQGEKFVLEGNARRNLDSAYYNYSTTPHFVEANFRSGGSGYIAALTADAHSGDTVLHLSNTDGIVAGDDIAFGIGGRLSSTVDPFTDRHTVASVGVGQVTLATALTANHNTGDTLLNAVRTMNQVWFVMMHQVAGGDAYIYGGQVQAWHGIPAGVTDFQENSTAGFMGGALEAKAEGVYLTAYEFQHNDNGHDIAAIGGLMNFNRSKGRFGNIVNPLATLAAPVSAGATSITANRTALGIAAGFTFQVGQVISFVDTYRDAVSGDMRTITGVSGTGPYTLTLGAYQLTPTTSIGPALTANHAGDISLMGGGGKYGTVWIGYYVNNGGGQPLDAGYYLAGYCHVGFDFVPGLYENGCAIGLGAGQKLFFNNSAGGTRSVLVGDVHGDVTQGYNGGTDTLDFTHSGNKSLSITETGIQVNGRANFKGWLTGTGAHNFGTIAAGGFDSFTISVTGAAEGDVCELGVVASADPGFVWKCIAVADGVIVVARNVSSGPLTSSSATYRVAVLKF